MNWDAIGAVGEILGALAVVGSLIYVGRQFRHSSTHSLHSLYAQTVSNFSANPANADVIFRGNNDPSQLTDAERYHCLKTPVVKLIGLWKFETSWIS